MEAAPENGVYKVKYFGKSPVQTEWGSEVGSCYPQSEDCLTLNVWTNEAGPREGKTVMVFFHGGSYLPKAVRSRRPAAGRSAGT